MKFCVIKRKNENKLLTKRFNQGYYGYASMETEWSDIGTVINPIDYDDDSPLLLIFENEEKAKSFSNLGEEFEVINLNELENYV